MNICLILVLLIKSIYSVQYNQPCTFSSGTCNWSIGRRWHIINSDNDDKILIADPESKEDKKNGFTDTIMSSWLHLSSLCSFDIRLTFQYSIENSNDFFEIYFIEKNRIKMNSLGQWKGIENKNKSLEDHQPIWQQGNITFKATEQFRIDIEIRHLPDEKNNSIVWFAIDDILIENCPIAIVNTMSSTITYQSTETMITTSIRYYLNETNSTLFNISQFKLDNLHDELPFTYFRQNLISLILYLLCALIALTLLIILFAIIIFTYRKHCCPTSLNDQRKKRSNNRVGIQIENIDQNNKTTDTTVRSCFE